MEQTAVEWLYDQLEFDDSISMETIHNVFEQAKEMERNQIEDAFEKGFITTQWDKTKENRAEQYYNETFKK
jgi:ribonuclease I